MNVVLLYWIKSLFIGLLCAKCAKYKQLLSRFSTRTISQSYYNLIKQNYLYAIRQVQTFKSNPVNISEGISAVHGTGNSVDIIKMCFKVFVLSMSVGVRKADISPQQPSSLLPTDRSGRVGHSHLYLLQYYLHLPYRGHQCRQKNSMCKIELWNIYGCRRGPLMIPDQRKIRRKMRRQILMSI